MADLRLPDFLVIPSSLVLDKDLRPTDHLVYGVVYWYSKLKLEKCILSNKSFANLLSITDRAVQYGLQRMSDKGYIKVVYEDENKRVRKEIIPLVSFAVNEANFVHPPTNKHSSPPHEVFAPPRTNVHQNNTNLIKEINNTDIHTKIFDYWNSKNIVVHRSLTDKAKRSINGRIKEGYKPEEIIQSIDNYEFILTSKDYFWNYKWTLQDFLQRGFEKFRDLKIAKQNYKKGGFNNGYENANRAEKGKYSDIKYE